MQERTAPTLKVASDPCADDRLIRAWTFPPESPPTIDASEKRSFGKGVFRRRDGCDQTPRRADDRQLRSVPPLRAASQTVGAEVARSPPRSRARRIARAPRRVGRAPPARGSPRLLRREGLPRPRPRRAEVVESERGDRDREGEDRGAPRRLRGVPLRLHGGLDGVRRRGEGDETLREGRHSPPAGRAPPRLGRGADAGGDPQPDADGQCGSRRASGSGTARVSVPQRASSPSHDGGRRGELFSAT